MGLLKGKSSLIIYENRKLKYKNREFQCRGYYVGEVAKNSRVYAELVNRK